MPAQNAWFCMLKMWNNQREYNYIERRKKRISFHIFSFLYSSLNYCHRNWCIAEISLSSIFMPTTITSTADIYNMYVVVGTLPIIIIYVSLAGNIIANPSDYITSYVLEWDRGWASEMYINSFTELTLRYRYLKEKKLSNDQDGRKCVCWYSSPSQTFTANQWHVHIGSRCNYNRTNNVKYTLFRELVLKIKQLQINE